MNPSSMTPDPAAPRRYESRDERLRPRPEFRVDAEADIVGQGRFHGQLTDVSLSGFRCLVFDPPVVPAAGTRLVALGFRCGEAVIPVGEATVRRCEPVWAGDLLTALTLVGAAFDHPEAAGLARLAPWVIPHPYVTDELVRGPAVPPVTDEPPDRTLLDFHRADGPDLFEKCRRFHGHVKDLQERGLYQALYRVTLTSGLDHRITVFNPHRRREEEMICFDSNSYLGLHLHPRVTGAVKRTLDQVGYGTPSAQLLCGTNRWLRELEQVVGRFHGREDVLVFPTGHAANVGAITGLVRENDLVVRDRFSHSSIHDGCRATGAGARATYPHGDMAALERILQEAGARGGEMGKLIVSDGVFSMHGRLARLPELAAIARRHGARLMLDDAHGTGVVGPTGRGTEEHYGLPGSADVLIGTFSKAAGAMGGYVCGSRDLVTYLRFYAGTAMFTAAPPAPLCAGLAEAYRVMDEEPQHRVALWRNVRSFVPALRDAGFLVPDEMESPIVTVFLGAGRLLWRFCRDLFDEGIKCGTVAYPAVPLGEAIARLAVNARHTAEDLQRTVDVFTRLGTKYGILHRSAEEVREIGNRLAAGGPA